MSTVVGPYVEVEAAYRRERIVAEYGQRGTRRHHPVRALGRVLSHRVHREGEAA